MTTQEIADRLVEMNRQNLHLEIYEELYDLETVESIENWSEREVHKGYDAIKKKGDFWNSAVEEMHETKVSDPLVADGSFAVTFYMDVTYNENMGPDMAGRSVMTELAIYHVNDAGKIYREEFFG